jgi:hypothetical protein
VNEREQHMILNIARQYCREGLAIEAGVYW